VSDVEWLVDAQSEQGWIADRLRGEDRQVRIAGCTYGVPVLLLPTVQFTDARVLARSCRSGLPMLRRYGGGAAVLAGPWLASLNLWVPAAQRPLPTGLAALRQWVGQMHVGALNRLGFQTRLAQVATAELVEVCAALRAACFGAASIGEVLDDVGRKVVGISQHRSPRGTWIGAGTLVGPTDWSLLCQTLALPGSVTRLLHERTSWCPLRARLVLTAVAAEVSCSLESACGAKFVPEYYRQSASSSETKSAARL